MIPHKRPPSGALDRSSVSGAPPILIVDDDPAGASDTADALTSASYPVVAESDGDAVLRLVRARVMRLVVSELYIPCAEARCVVAALKQDRAHLPRLQVLVHTRHTAPVDVEWALSAGADGLVLKQAPEGVLLREIRRLDTEVEAA
jgi:CheY-like chemotaxis protein